MVQVGESAEELACTAHLVANHKPVLAATFDLEDLDNGTIPLLDVPHDILVDLQRIRTGLLKEDGIRYSANVSFAVREKISSLNLIIEIRSRTYPSVRVDGGGTLGRLHFVTK